MRTSLRTPLAGSSRVPFRAPSWSPFGASLQVPFLVGAVVLAAVLVPVLGVGGRPLGVDLAVGRVLSSPGSDLAGAVTQLGSGAVLYPVLAVLAFVRVSSGSSWRRAVVPLVVLAVAQMIEAVTFVTLVRPTPLDGSGSFSSGHAMAAVLGWGLVAREFRRPRLFWLVGIVGVAVGLSRVVLGLHWVTDVVAGWALGVMVLAAVAAWPAPVGGVRAPVLEPSGPPRWLTTSRGAWVLPGLALLVPLVPLFLVSGDDRMKDLLVYYGAGSTAGTGSDVYEFRTVFDMPFTYPPFAAVLSEPLSRVPLGLLQVLWVAASLAALVGVARFAMQPVVARIGLPLTLALLLVSAPVRSHLRFGQVGLFLVLLVAVDLLRRHRREGIGLGVAIAVKLTPAVFVPWLLVTRRWRTFMTVTVTAVGATLAGLLLLWPSAAEYLWRALWDSDRFGANDVVGNQSVRGMLLRTGLPDHTVSLLWLASALLLVAVATLGARRLERDGNRLGAVGVLAALSVAVSPISWVHHLVWLVLPLSALVAARRYVPAAVWAVLLTVSLPSIGAAGLRAGAAHPVFWHFVVDAQGLTAVAAVLFLPWAVRARP
ncbi:glycosyltransferase 87 family protein [Cryptosporangium aurantiacum]|uniref:PAP2 superfamily protein n=1 Tax=Cryptosporangium aurantiacum TaxID=134849 RepID=A0A1M7R935_9ACTN|nr:glycosyltransferase 87 family protein [Cryptosporangium aurantiacum]SHN42753.1 PAP2 superfamily protein [Cryptosporangium aurantiacum]